MNSIKFSAVLNERRMDYENKDKLCSDIESTLNNHYKTITKILNELKDEDDENQMGLLVDFLCKNEDSNDPGVRDHASFARFDYVKKCNQADAAYCELRLVEVIKRDKLLFRKYDHYGGEMGTFKYTTGDVASIADKEKSEWNVELDCNIFDDSPFQYKPLPFDPELLNTTCGDAGYEYYVQ